MTVPEDVSLSSAARLRCEMTLADTSLPTVVAPMTTSGVDATTSYDVTVTSPTTMTDNATDVYDTTTSDPNVSTTSDNSVTSVSSTTASTTTSTTSMSTPVDGTVIEVLWLYRVSSQDLAEVVYVYNTSSAMATGALQGRADGSLTSLEHVLEIHSTYLNDTGIYTCTAIVAAGGASYNDSDQGYMTVTGAYDRHS